MPEIVHPHFQAGRFVGEDPGTGILAVIAGDGTEQVMNTWDVASGDVTYVAPSGTNAGAGNTRRHLFDAEVYANSGTRAAPTYVNVRAWGSITGKPTTLGGYGITDALPNNANGTTTGTITSAGFIVTGAAATERKSTYQTAGVTRWTSGAGSAAESGSNAGSNYLVRAYDDAGTLIGTAFHIDRIATGNIYVWRHLITNSDNAYDLGISGARFRNLALGGNAAVGGSLAVNGATGLGAPFAVLGNVRIHTAGAAALSLALAQTGVNEWELTQKISDAAFYIQEGGVDRLKISSGGAFDFKSGAVSGVGAFTVGAVNGTNKAITNNLNVAAVAGGAYGYWQNGTLTATANADTLRAMQLSPTLAGGALANVSAFGFLLTPTFTGAGASSTLYGMYLDIPASAVTNWALYSNSAVASYLGGALSIGGGALPAGGAQMSFAYDGTNGSIQTYNSGALKLNPLGNNVSVGGNLLALTDNAFDVGGVSSGRFRDLNLARNAIVGGTITATGLITASGGVRMPSATKIGIGLDNADFPALPNGSIGIGQSAYLTAGLGSGVGTLARLIGYSGGSVYVDVDGYGALFGGAVLAAVDNAKDIGATGTQRFRDLNLGRNAVLGGTLTATGATFVAGGVNVLLNATAGAQATTTYQNNSVQKWVAGLNYSVGGNTWELYNSALGATALSFGIADSAANFSGKVGVGINPTYQLHVSAAINANYISRVVNSDATSPFGVWFNFSAASPNNTSNQFWLGTDSTGTRGELRANGGIANYSANNVNLSDATTKRLGEAIDGRYASDVFLSLGQASVWTRYQYHNQTHDDWNLGTTAQALSAALPAELRPSIVDPDGWREVDGSTRWAIHEQDLAYLSMAAVSNHAQRIADLEAEVARLTTELKAA